LEDEAFADFEYTIPTTNLNKTEPLTFDLDNSPPRMKKTPYLIDPHFAAAHPNGNIPIMFNSSFEEESSSPPPSLPSSSPFKSSPSPQQTPTKPKPDYENMTDYELKDSNL